MITGNEPISMATTDSGHVGSCPGLTIRQHFAAMAMQGVFAGLYSVPDLTGWDTKGMVKQAVDAADALINELNKQP